MPDDDLFDGISAPADTGLFAGIKPATEDLFAGVESPKQTQLETAIGRKQAEVANIEDNIAKLQAIKPANAEHKKRIDDAIARLQGEIDGGFVLGTQENRGSLDNLSRGITAGVSKALLLGGADLALLPFKALGIDDAVPGVHAFERQVEEAKQNIQEVADPEGKAGTLGDFVGTIAGSVPAYGAAAELTGEQIVAKFPGSRVAKAIAATKKPGASVASRVLANIGTGLPINAAQALGTQAQEITPDMTPEQRESAERANKAAKLEQLAIGLIADGLFGAIARPIKEKPKLGDAPPANLPPDREAQFQALKKKADEQVAAKAKRDEVRKEWRKNNPGRKWSDLSKADQQMYYDLADIPSEALIPVDGLAAHVTSNPSDPNLDNSHAELQRKIVELNNQLKESETKRNEIERMAERDPDMGIGNGRALGKAIPAADADPNSVFLFFDSNGTKGINDTLGHQTGDQLLMGNRDALIRSLREHGLIGDDAGTGRIFRPKEGSDELVAIVPRDKAESILQKAEKYSIQQFGELNGNMSGAIYDSFAEGMSIEGNARLQSRKIIAKAKFGIPGRNAEEQELIDAVKKQMDQAAQVEVEPEVAGPSAAPEVSGGESGVAGKIEEDIPAIGARFFDEHGNEVGGQQTEGKVVGNIAPRAEEPSVTAEPSPATTEPASSEISRDGAVTEPTPETQPSTPGTRPGSDSELQGIEKGKPGVTIEAADPPEAGSFVVARDKRGNPVGYLLLEKVEGKTYRALEVFVSAASRRKGVATSMYKAAKDAGLDVVSGDFGLSDEGAALVKNLDDKGIVRAAKTTPSEEPPASKGTFLESINHKKPLEELTEKQLDKLDDRIMSAIEKETPGTDKYKALQSDLDKLMENQRRLNMEAKKDQATPVNEAPTDFSAPERGSGAATPVEESNRLLGDHARTLMKKSLRTMNIDDLKLHIDDLQARLSGMTVMEGQEYRQRLDKALAEVAERLKSDQGRVAQIPPGVGGAGLGFALGYMQDPDEDGDRMTNALEWAAVGAAAGTVAGRMLKRGGAPRLTVPEDRLPSELPGKEWQAEARKTIVHNPPRGRKPIPFLERMRHIYASIARNTYTAERFQQSLGGSRLPTELNAAKQFGMFGRYTGQTESALRYGPAVYDEFGNVRKLDAKGIGDILDMVKGDAESLGDLMAALTTMEQAGKVKNPMPLEVAERVYHAMPEEFHAAAAEARKFSLAMADVGVDGGVISPEARDLFSQESFYAPMLRIFGFDNTKITSAEPGKVVAQASSPFKARTGGSSKAVLSPFQSMVDMIPRIYRAAELNKIKNLWVDTWESAGKPAHLMERISKDKVQLSPQHEVRIQQIQNELKMSRADAERLVAGMDPSVIDPLSGTMRLYRNGTIESYRVPKDLAKAMLTLAPDDMHMVVKVLGLPSRLAVKGITMHPFFVAKMAFFDMWQATLNSQYGFRFGVDNIKGFLAAATDNKKYRDFLAAGGQHQAIYGPSRTNFSTAIEDIKARKGSPLEVAVRQIKQLKPVEAWKTLITPISDAARVGEYLRAKAHGASDIEAVHAAKVVTANYNEAGSWGAMRSLQHMTMFLGPALQVMDQATYRAGINPFRSPEEGRAKAALQYGLKAFTTIALPSFYFWFANKDDKDITDLRQTQLGSKYWFARTPGGQIFKIPKPPVDGQIFGTSFEGILDKYYSGDPHGMDRISGAILKDAAFNILPTIGVLPYSLQTNTNLGLGIPIVPEGDRDLELQYQGADKASWLARAISQRVAPLASGSSSDAIKTGATPAGIDFLINGLTGMLGQDLTLGISQSVEAESKGYVPAKDELPIIKRVLVKYPQEHVRSVNDFYNRAEKVQTVSATINYLVRHDPDKLASYVESKQADVALVGLYGKARQKIANYHRLITDIKNAPAGTMSQADRKKYIDQITVNIITIARMIDEFTVQSDGTYDQQ